MTEVTRRTLLLSTAFLGTGILTACTQEPSPENPRSTVSEAPYGVGRYNTQEVADELRYIEQNIRPLPTGEGIGKEY
ncbi:hypothetical protein M1D88_09265 [Arthrobacter sp. R1-13]